MMTVRMSGTDPDLGHKGGDTPGTRLESWKEIAAYLGRDVTTVQRWERREGLPVHRLLHSKIGSIFAYTNELEAWRATRSQQVGRTTGTVAAVGPDPESPVVAPDIDAVAPAPPSPLPPGAPSPGDASPVAAPAPPASRWLVATLSLLLVITLGLLAWEVWGRDDRARSAPGAPIRAIAVLPLRNLSGDPAQEYFVDGMTEAVIARLASLGGVQVTSRTSVMQFKSPDRAIPDIARALGVDAVLEGSVIRQGDRVRVIAQLIDGRTDAHLWATEYDREVRDVLALQAELAQAIAGQIRTTVRQPAAAQAERTVSAQAYEHYLKGRFLLNESTADSVQRSLEEFRASIAADPTFAPAYAGLASAHTDLGTVLIGATPGGESVERAAAAANEALERDPQLAEAYSVLGRALVGQWRWTEAEAAFTRALDLNPSDARTHYWWAEWLIAHQRNDEAIASAKRARDLDPLSMRIGAEYGLILGLARRHEEAVTQLRSVLAVQPDHVQAMWWMGTNLIDAGRPAEALASLERAAALSGRSSAILGQLARAYGKLGRRADAERLRDELVARSRDRYVPPTSLATALLAAGDREGALQRLERAIDEKANGLHLTWVSAASDPLRPEARFQALHERMGLSAPTPE